MPGLIAPQPRPIRKERLFEAVYGEILKRIVEANYVEGDRLPSEADLSAAFEVSRPVVREALMRLQADGLVTARRGSGTYVARRPSARLPQLVDSSDVSAYLRSFEPRIVIEAETARLAAMRRTATQLRRIQDAVGALASAIRGGTLGMDEDIAFHRTIAEAAGNDYFPLLLDQLHGPVQSTMRIGLELARGRSAIRRQRVVEEHAKICDAVAAQDSDCASTYMRHHLFQARAAVVDPDHLER